MAYIFMICVLSVMVFVVVECLWSWFTDHKYRVEEHGIGAGTKREYKNIWEYISRKY